MELSEYRRMFELEDHHWWFQGRLLLTEQLWRRHILPAFAPRRPRLLDCGCGTGLWLQRRAADSDGFGIDLAPAALAYCQERALHRVGRASADRLPFPDATFDVVTAFDLIEHVASDGGLIAEFARVLRPGGLLLATVPAHPFLWTGHDVSLHHHRRYRRAQFDALFDAGQWQTVRMSAGFTLIFPPAAAIRLGRRLVARGRPPQSDAGPVAPWLNRSLIALHRLEAAWLARADLPIGISLMTIRRRI